MTNEQPKFNVLLSERTISNSRGLEAAVVISGASFYSTHSFNAEHGRVCLGVPNSIQVVQDAGLVQVSTYMLVEGKIAEIRKAREQGDINTALNSTAWRYWYDTLGEELVLNAKGYDGISDGVYVVGIQGGGLFTPRPNALKEMIIKNKINRGAVPISQVDKDLLLRDKHVYKWTGSKVERVPVTLYILEEFLEASAAPDFLKGFPVYAVLQRVEDAQKVCSGLQSIKYQLENSRLAIHCGGKEQLRKMLVDDDGNQHFGWATFGFYPGSYTNVDCGNMVTLLSNNTGLNYQSIGSFGRSLGVEPATRTLIQNLDSIIR